MTRRIANDGDEQDAFSPWRRYYRWRPGQIKRIKRRANKRDRRNADAATREHMRDWQAGRFTHQGEDD